MDGSEKSDYLAYFCVYNLMPCKMGKGKLRKFADLATYPNVIEAPYAAVADGPFRLKGGWGRDFFGNSNPIVLELGCGRGEYTIGLARLYPEKNFIGVDIKGARLWTGATQALNEKMGNVAFLRTNIEIIDRFFAADEVTEIWLTFIDPQMRKATKRLSSTYFLERYRHFLTDGGLVHLKTDSRFLFTYTMCVVSLNGLPLRCVADDLYGVPPAGGDARILGIKTYYEMQWIERGMKIKYLCFGLPREGELEEPDVEIDKDDYRSFNRWRRVGGI